MSPRSGATSPPVSVESSSAVRRRSSSPRAVIATLQPSCASSRAVALPMPLLAPVTNATAPSSPRSITPPLGGRTPAAPDDRASATGDRRPCEPAARGTEDLGGREQRVLAVRRGDQVHADREAGVRRGERDGEGGEPRDVGG